MTRLAESSVAVLLTLFLAGSGAGQGVADLVERARPAVAIVVARTGSGVSRGSGFVYDARGFLLTAAHVVEGAGEVVVRLPNRRPMLAVVAQTSRSMDVAALRVGEEGLPFIPLAAGRPRVGEEVVVLGYPLGDVIGLDDITVTRGVVSRLLVDQGLLQFDASVNPGNSGGPVLNGRGEAVGIVVRRIREAAGINFAVLSEAARDVARLALQVPFAPSSPPSIQTPPPPPPAPTPEPPPGELRLVARKGPTPRNREIQTPANLAVREAHYAVRDGSVYILVALYDAPAGDAEIWVHWRLPGSSIPRWALRYFPSRGRHVFGRVIRDEARGLWNVEPVYAEGVVVLPRGTWIGIALPVSLLRPTTPYWEIQVGTSYLGADGTYNWVDWLPWTRITL